MRKLLFAVAALLTTISLSAQNIVPGVTNSSDVRGRLGGAFEWEIIDDLSLEALLEMRLNNDFTNVDRLQTGIGLEYEVCKYLNIGAGYQLINIHEPGAWKSPRHRANINVEGNIKVGRFDFALRERLQTTFRTDSVNRYEKSDPEAILRSRFVTTYKIPHSRWSPYLLFELHNTLNAPKAVANYKTEKYETDNYITRYRGGVGAKYRINRYHRLDFYYYIDFDRSYNIDYKGNSGKIKGFVLDRELRHIFGISYKFKL